MTGGGTLVVEQPSYVPWLGYFDLMAQADVWVWLDDVQYTRRDWRNRNRLARGREPTCAWLTVPVRSSDHRALRIDQVRIDYQRPWQRKHIETYRHCCGSGPFFTASNELLRRHVEARTERLVDLCIGLGEAIGNELGLTARFCRSSELTGVDGRKQERLLSICRAIGAETYLSGPAAQSYIDPASFKAHGTELRYAVYDYPAYPRGGRPFVSNLSILDPLAWIGPRATAELLTRRSWPASRDVI